MTVRITVLLLHHFEFNAAVHGPAFFGLFIVDRLGLGETFRAQIICRNTFDHKVLLNFFSSSHAKFLIVGFEADCIRVASMVTFLLGCFSRSTVYDVPSFIVLELQPI